MQEMQEVQVQSLCWEDPLDDRRQDLRGTPIFRGWRRNQGSLRNTVKEVEELNL